MTLNQAEQLGKVLAPEGVTAKAKTFDSETLVYYLSKGYTVAIAIDSNSFWNGSSFQKVDHLVAILGVTTDENGAPISFDIVDSGLGYETMTVEQLEGCTADIIYGIAFHAKEC